MGMQCHIERKCEFQTNDGPYVLKLYLCIYIFIEYLKCVWKSNCIWIIRNYSKKEKKVRTTPSGPGSASGLGRVRRRKPSQV